MADTETNPRAVIGGNDPPLVAILRALPLEENFAERVAEFMKEEYGPLLSEVDRLLDECRQEPSVIEDEAAKSRAASLIRRLRELSAKLEAAHAREKLPFWTGGQAVDTTFFGPIGKLRKRNRGDRKGASEILNDRLTDFDTRVLAAEQARRQKIADEEAAAARAAEAERVRLAQAAEEASRAAERARKPETIEAKTEVAAAAADQATDAQVEATVAFGRAEKAHIETLATPAAIMRKRDEDTGILTTMAQETYAEVVDRTKLNFAALAPYFALADVEKALRAWAKATDYRTPMEGAAVGRRPKSKVL